MVTGQKVTLSALASFGTEVGAFGDAGSLFASAGASRSTELVVAVGWAFHGCKEDGGRQSYCREIKVARIWLSTGFRHSKTAEVHSVLAYWKATPVCTLMSSVSRGFFLGKYFLTL